MPQHPNAWAAGSSGHLGSIARDRCRNARTDVPAGIAVATCRPGVAGRADGRAGRGPQLGAVALEVLTTDFVARAADVTAQPPLLLVSGERDHSALRTDAAALVDALCEQYANPDDVELITMPALSHPLADEPAGIGPQLPSAKVVGEILTQGFLRQLTGKEPGPRAGPPEGKIGDRRIKNAWVLPRHLQIADHAPARVRGTDDLRMASFVASNGVLRIRTLCMEFIGTCTDSLGVHRERDEDRTRSPSGLPGGCARRRSPATRDPYPWQASFGSKSSIIFVR
jgi:hypothetical protein